MNGFFLALQQTEPLASGGSLITGQALLSAFVVVALLAAAAWALKRTGTLRRAQVPIVVESAVALGERRSLVVVSVEGRRLLLGMAPQYVGLVTELKPTGVEFGRALDASLSGKTS
jgi:flagellar protein FliO/FliZ